VSGEPDPVQFFSGCNKKVRPIFIQCAEDVPDRCLVRGKRRGVPYNGTAFPVDDRAPPAVHSHQDQRTSPVYGLDTGRGHRPQHFPRIAPQGDKLVLRSEKPSMSHCCGKPPSTFDGLPELRVDTENEAVIKRIRKRVGYSFSMVQQLAHRLLGHLLERSCGQDSQC
jgi:hypothetical protein